jgi:hypothetical protein
MFSPNCQLNIRWGIQTSPKWVSPLECSRPCYSKGYTTLLTTCGEARIEPQGALLCFFHLWLPLPSFFCSKSVRGLKGDFTTTIPAAEALEPRTPPAPVLDVPLVATKGSITTFQHWCIIWQGNIMFALILKVMFLQTKLFTLHTKIGPCIWGHNVGVTMLFRHTLDNYSGWNRLPKFS